MEAAACQLSHPGILSVLGKGTLLVKRSVADSLWWDPAEAGKELALWTVHIGWTRRLQPSCLGELSSGRGWWEGCPCTVLPQRWAVGRQGE